MPAWAAFGALTIFLLAVLLLLSIASARTVDSAASVADRSTALDRSERFTGQRSTPPDAAPAVDPRLPRFEAPEAPHETASAVTEQPGMSAGALLANVAITQGVFGIALLAGAFYFAIPLASLGVGLPLVRADLVAIGVVVGLFLWAGNELAAGVADAAGVGYDESVRSMLTPTSVAGWFLLLGVILPTVALVEELLFRGAAIGALSVGFDVSAPVLVVASSLAFGGAHGAQGRIGALVATALGLVLGVVFVLTNSLLVVVVAHYLVNALEFVVHEGLDVDRPLTVCVGHRR